MKLEEKIAEAIEPALENKGYGLARVRLVKSGKLVLAVDIDRLDDGHITVNDCTEASRLISAILDVEDFIKETYTLEVSSPGASRPLSKIGDFERFCGKVAKIELWDCIDGMRRFSGEIVKVDGLAGIVVIRLMEGQNLAVNVPFSNIRKASVSRGF